MKKLCIFLIVLAVTASGCSYANDIDEQAFIIAVGVDKGVKESLSVTFLFSTPSPSQGGGEGGGESGGDNKNKDMITIEAPTIFSAARRLNAIKSKKINLTHTKLIVFSEKLAKEGIKDYVLGLVSSRDFRPTTYICVSKGKTEKYLKSIKPTQDTFIEKYIDHIMSKTVSDKVGEAYLYYLYFNLLENYSSSMVPLVGVNDNKLPDDSEKSTYITDDLDYSKKAGSIPRKSDNKAEVSGYAIFKNDRMVTTLGEFSSTLAKLICNEYYDENFSFYYPHVENYVTVTIRQKEPPVVKTKIKKGNAVVKINVPIEIKYVDPHALNHSDLSSLSFQDFLEKKLNKKAKSLIKKMQQTYNCDILGIGDHLKKHFLTVKQWENFKWKNKYNSADISVSFKITEADYEEIY